MKQEDIPYLEEMYLEFERASELYNHAKRLVSSILDQEGILSDEPDPSPVILTGRTHLAAVKFLGVVSIIEEKINEVKTELHKRGVEIPAFVSAMDEEMRQARNHIEVL